MDAVPRSQRGIQVGGHSIRTADVEAHLVVEGGKSRERTVACPKGSFATSGGFLADAVDGGDDAAVLVLSSRTTADRLGWTVSVRNNEGRAQGKVKVSCVSFLTTAAEDGHAHGFTAAARGTATTSIAAGAGGTLTAGCAAGTIPVRPSYASTGAVLPTGSTVSGTAVTFAFDALEPATVDVSVDCLQPDLTPAADGHSHAVRATVVDATKPVRLRAGISEQVVVCPAGSTSLLPTWTTKDEAGLYFLGSDPRGTQRMYRFLNESEEPSDALVGMTCLSTVTPPAPEAKAIKLGSTVLSSGGRRSTSPSRAPSGAP